MKRKNVPEKESSEKVWRTLQSAALANSRLFNGHRAVQISEKFKAKIDTQLDAILTQSYAIFCRTKLAI